MSDKSRDLDTLFHDALAIASPDERRVFLDEQCGSDADLRIKIEELLSANSDMGEFLDQTRDESSNSLMPEALGSKIGRYKLLQVIGEGGMGVVYMAQQDEPVQRKVALKIIKLGMDTKEVVARFEAERQALAMMDHPNIARALDAGATETGRPYFVMELVQGIPITEFCERSKLRTDQRLKLFIDVCHAVQSAHQKGIIHRDIKPSNVLVTLHHGEPMPKVIDFGVSKAVNQRLTEKTYFTRFATMIGTPAYMSPEQAEMSSMDVDTRTDVYSLGVLLYRLLTGSTPFSEERLRSVGFGEMQRIIVEEPPEKPSTRLSTSSSGSHGKDRPIDFDATLERDLKGELDWITLKCLEKDRGRRYATPNELAADVQRFLDEEPVLAVAPTLAYQLKKLYQRNKSVARLSAALLLALVLGLGFSIWQWTEADDARQIAVNALDLASKKTEEAKASYEVAKREEEKAKNAQQATSVALYSSNIVRARLETQAYNADGADAVLDQCEESHRGWEWHLLKQRVRSSMLTLTGHADIQRREPDASWIYDVECSPDGRWIASAGGGNPIYKSTPGGPSGPGEIIIWDAETGQQVWTLTGHQHVVHDVAFSPDSKTLVSVSRDETLRLWDVASGQTLRTIDAPNPDRSLHAVAFSPDGKYLAAGGTVDSEINPGRYAGLCWIWSLPTYERQSVMRHEPGHVNSSTSVLAIRFSPDSKQLYSMSDFVCSTPLQAWDLENNRDIPITSPSENIWKNGLDIDPSGDLVAVSSSEYVQFWNKRTGRFDAILRTHTTTEDVAFNPNGSGEFATCGHDSTIRIWGSASSAGNTIEPPLMTLLGHTGRVLSLDYAPDGNRLISSGSDGTVRIWDLTRDFDHANVPVPPVPIAFNKYDMYSMAFNSDGSQLTIARTFGDVLTVDVNERTAVATKKITASRNLAFYLDDTATVAVGAAHWIHVRDKKKKRGVYSWDLPSGRERPLMITDYLAPVSHVVCTTKAKLIATASGLLSSDGQSKLERWDGKTGEIKVWDGDTGEALFELSELHLSITRLAFSPSGDHLAVACRKRLPKQNDKYKYTIRVYDVGTGELFREYDDFSEQTWALAFDRQGKRLAASGVGKRNVIIWELFTHNACRSTQGIRNATDLAFSPDGLRLALVNKYETKVLDSTSGDELLVLYSRHQLRKDPGRPYPRALWSPDGRSLAVASRSLSIWTIPDSNARQLANEELTRSARRRSISYQLEALFPLVEKYNDRIRQGMQVIVDVPEKNTLSTVPLTTVRQYKLRAEIFKFMNQPEKAAADIAEAARLEKQNAEE